LREALRLRPGMLSAHAMLIDILLETGKLKEALAHVEALPKNRRTLPWVAKVKGDIFRRAGRFQEAVKAYAEALDHFGLPHTIHQALASEEEDLDWEALAEACQPALAEIVAQRRSSAPKRLSLKP
ncbi:MAG: hypothetical protein D6819_03885, partial [Gammaproteobacteria bacterium]